MARMNRVSVPDGTRLQVWHDYVAGTDPLDPASVFTASITLGTDGTPVVGWSPRLSDEETAKRVYRVFGKARLSDAAWTETDPDHAGDYRFFKVTVEMK